MLSEHLVRCGLLGEISRFTARDPVRYPRGARVICRTSRGVEVGEVMSATRGRSGTPDGSLLRAVTLEDELLLTRIEKNRQSAFHACRGLLAERGIPAILVDVELLFDGQSLYFYFLGDTPPELDAITGELAEVYEAQVKFRRFAETLIAGCGPDCGTTESSCGDGGCKSCPASACGIRPRREHE